MAIFGSYLNPASYAVDHSSQNQQGELFYDTLPTEQ